MRILRGLTSRLLPCGCVTGVYETYGGEIVTLLDEPQATCPDPNHAEGNQISALAGAAGPETPTAEPDSDRRP